MSGAVFHALNIADSDFLLILLKSLLHLRTDLKLILMSATIDAEIFKRYLGCDVIEIEGRTFPVNSIYKEEFKKIGIIDDSQEEETEKSAEKSANYKTDYGIIARILLHIHKSGEKGGVLIFLSGIMEIKFCIDRLKNDLGSIINDMEIMPLHSGLSSKEQQQVFKKTKLRKVVISTNIAETSVTIEDIGFVIDSGRVKEMGLVNNVLSLQEIWASRAACKQRQGRAGRVREGTCYKLYTSNFEKKLNANTVPEILRLPLDQLCLQILAMNIADVHKFLALAISPPLPSNIDVAIETLLAVKAIDCNGHLTAIGKHISKIPVDLKIAKMLLFGATFNVIDPVLSIAAYLSGKNPLLSPADKRVEAAIAQSVFAVDGSDQLKVCNVYNAWEALKSSGRRAQEDFCNLHFLSSSALSSMALFKKQTRAFLVELNYISKNQESSNNEVNLNLVKAAIVAGLYPNIANVVMPTQLFEQTSYGTVPVLPQPSNIKFFTKDEGRVFIHPSSSLFSKRNYNDSIVIYGIKVATSKIFLRDCTAVKPLALILMGGKLEMIHEGNTLLVDNLRFKAFPRITMLIEGLRKLLDGLLDRKIMDPTLDCMSTEIGKAFVRILS